MAYGVTLETISPFNFISAEETDQLKNVSYLNRTAETLQEYWKPA